jgi:hypothetical protein
LVLTFTREGNQSCVTPAKQIAHNKHVNGIVFSSNHVHRIIDPISNPTAVCVSGILSHRFA